MQARGPPGHAPKLDLPRRFGLEEAPPLEALKSTPDRPVSDDDGMSDFEDVFAPLAPVGTARFALTGIAVRSDKDVVLIGRHAGRSNRALTNAVLKMAKAQQGKLRASSTQQLAENDAMFARMFARYVLTGWENVYGSDGKPIPFTADKCEEFLLALGAMRPGIAGAGGAIDQFFSDEDNFRPPGDEAPDALALGEG